MPHPNLDKTDLRILQVLQENRRLSNVELSEKVALSSSPYLHRLKQLEDAGTIQKYAAQPSPVSPDLSLQVFIRVSTSEARGVREDFSKSARAWPKILSCFALTGETDYLLHAFFTDMNALFHFVLDTLFSHHGVQDAQPSSILKEIKDTTALSLVHLVQD